MSEAGFRAFCSCVFWYPEGLTWNPKSRVLPIKLYLFVRAVEGTGKVEPEPNDPRNVIVKKLALVVEGRPDEEIDLTGDMKDVAKTVRKVLGFFSEMTNPCQFISHYIFVCYLLINQVTATNCLLLQHHCYIWTIKETTWITSCSRLLWWRSPFSSGSESTSSFRGKSSQDSSTSRKQAGWESQVS